MAALSNLKQCPSLATLPDYAQRHNQMPEFERYPVVNLKNDLLNTSAQRFYSHNATPRNLLIPVSESVLKRITRTFFESGFWDSLTEARNEQTRQQSPWIGKTGDYIAQVLGLYTTLKLKVFPHTQELSAERIAQYAETRDWMNSDIRYIAWHGHCFKLAVAGADDVVRIYGKNSNSVPVLKSASQTQVTCMAWRPLCAAEIVIGCRQGLCRWIIDSNLQLTRSTTPNHIHKHPANLPISSLQWNKDGSLLATASIGERAILIWQLEQGVAQALKRLGPPSSLLKWSPGNDWLFAGTVDRVFRVWNCDKRWTAERWVCNGGTVQTACWSPCGRFLLFVSTAEPILYRLQFVQQHLLTSASDDKEVLPIADLNACSLDSSNQTLIGGQAQQLAWDPHGKYLIVTFKATNSIAVFHTYIQKFDLQISAAYYLTGESPAEHPSFICFQPLYKPTDRSVLTIAWSSGRIQYYAFD